MAESGLVPSHQLKFTGLETAPSVAIDLLEPLKPRGSASD